MRSIESRIITLFIVFILAIQAIGFVWLQRIQENKARATIAIDLGNGKQAIQRLLDQQTILLSDSVNKVVNDSKLINALLVDDSASRSAVKSILAAQAAKLNASLAWMVSKDGRIQAVSSPYLSEQLKQAGALLISHAEHQEHASTIAINNTIPTQLITSLIRTPSEEAWIVMAFPLSEGFIAELEKVQPFPVTILTKNKQQWRVAGSSLSDAAATMLAKTMPLTATTDIEKLVVNGKEYSVQLIELIRKPAEKAIIVLQGSISGTVTPSYNKIQVGLILITLISLTIAVFGNVRFTRRISNPLRQLSDVAKRLGSGDYDCPIEVAGDEEIRDLAHAFSHMRDGIAQRENEIKRLAYWDTLTRLPNRTQFISLLRQVIATTKAHEACFVLILDLDRFKHVNDIMGHSLGDVLLQKVANRLRKALPDAQLARLGGDEFALLLPRSTLIAAQKVALTIALLLEEPVMLEGQTIDLSAGIGLAGYPENGEDAETILSHAEVAMYAAKRKTGNSCFMVYSPEIDRSSQQTLSLVSELRKAIDENQLRLFVQPKFDLKEREIVGLEALVRWVHPTRGFLSPDQFIPFAEKTGVIRFLTRWMLNKSAALCAELIAHGIHLKVSVNISTHDLLDQDLPGKLADILQRHRVKASAFCLEITESAIMHDPRRAQVTLERLNLMNVELSIDDFGTGYSSLSYLKRLPVNELKIDKSFVLNIHTDGDDRKIVKSTIELGHNLGLRVVAEGVEDEAVMALLTQMGCDQAQGNYINSAMPAEQLVDWLEQREARFWTKCIDRKSRLDSNVDGFSDYESM